MTCHLLEGFAGGNGLLHTPATVHTVSARYMLNAPHTRWEVPSQGLRQGLRGAVALCAGPGLQSLPTAMLGWGGRGSVEGRQPSRKPERAETQPIVWKWGCGDPALLDQGLDTQGAFVSLRVHTTVPRVLRMQTRRLSPQITPVPGRAEESSTRMPQVSRSFFFLLAK